MAWFARHPGFQAARKVFVELLGAAVAPFGPGVRVPGELIEMQLSVVARMERWKEQQEQQWKQQWKQEGLLEGEQRGERRGEATLLLRQLERRFGVVPDWARDRALAADTATIEDWGLRVLDAASLEDVFA